MPDSSGPDLLADVFASEDLPAGLALEAAQMPLLVQSQQGLPVLNVPSAASAVWKKAAGSSGFCHSPCKTQGGAAPPPQHSQLCWSLCSKHRFTSCVKSSPVNPAGPVLMWPGGRSDLSGAHGTSALHLQPPGARYPLGCRPFNYSISART